MSGENGIACDLCGGPTIFRLDPREAAVYPAARVFTCRRCGYVMWQKSRPRQQQQQRQIENPSESRPRGSSPLRPLERIQF
jgi:hypothetical protein